MFIRALACCLLCVGTAVHSQEPPHLLSVTPADGATGVATNSSIVFVFDQDMDTTIVPFGSVPGAFVGNFEIVLPSVFFSATWGADKRTLTLTSIPGLPADTLVVWTLNPPGDSISPKLSSAAGVQLDTVSGSFRTIAGPVSGPAPKLESVTPAIGATNVSPDADLVFVFDTVMDTNVVPVGSVPGFIGNYSIQPAGIASQFQGTWAGDRRTLRLRPSGNLTGGITVNWTLNPAGSTTPLKSAEGSPLATTNGTYTVLANTGGNPNENCNIGATNQLAGYYSVFKNYSYAQNSASEVLPVENSAFVFGAAVANPVRTRAPVTAASITFPDGATNVLTNQFGTFIYYDFPPAETQLNVQYPAGSYTLRLVQGGVGEHTIAMNMPETVATIPAIANYDEAQAIDPAQSFTLRWTAMSPVPADAYIAVSITDVFGNTIFTAPNPCIPRELGPTDTSIVIPANYLKGGQRYHGTLIFGQTFYYETRAVPDLTGSGTIVRVTSFSLEAAAGANGGGPTILPARFLDLSMTETGPRMTLSGTPGQTYTIQRVPSLPAGVWENVGVVTMNPAGEAVYQDLPGRTAQRLNSAFYRAVTGQQGGPEPRTLPRP